tara:strand:- start:306 stop:560 length:255 start_codon:yes stop_codon:yes gene_type:complete
MCIFGLFQQQKKGGGFTPGDTKQLAAVDDAPAEQDLTVGDKADIKIGGKGDKIATAGAVPPTTGVEALSINPQPTGINTGQPTV